MDPRNKSFESANALAALCATYHSRLPEPSCSTIEHHSRRCPTLVDTGVAENGYEQIVNSEHIGREAFLLDESLRHAQDGKLLRLPLDDIKCQSSVHSRGESMAWNAFDDRPLSTYGWGLPERRDWEEWPKPRAGQGAWLELMPVSRLTAAENVSAMNTPVAALQEQTLVGESHSEALVEEIYHQIIDEAQCC